MTLLRRPDEEDLTDLIKYVDLRGLLPFEGVSCQGSRRNLQEICPIMPDFTARRRMMVDTQIRPSDVTKFPIIEAFLRIPREAFVPVGKQEVAYGDDNLDLGDGRVVLAPRTLAKMLDALDLQPSELLLVVGAGLGYSAAVAGQICQAVVALESDPDLSRDAEAILAEQEVYNVATVEGALADGVQAHSPYDAILIEGAVEQLSDVLVSQLKDGGRIIAIFAQGALGTVRIGYKIAGKLTWRFAFDAGAPVLQEFVQTETFVL